MSYTLTIEIDEDSPQNQNIEAISQAEHISREEAVLRLLASSQVARRLAAIKAVTGSLQGTDWSIHDFNDEKYADIEREN